MERARFVGLVFAFALTSGAAAAQERRPTDVQTINPITVPSRAAPGQTEAGAAAQAGLREIPFGVPLSAAALAEAKRRAATDSRVGVPDQALQPSEIPATITASFFGTNIAQAASPTREGTFGLVPPDPQVAASPQRVVHVVNSSIRLFTRGGARIQTRNLNAFFGTPFPPTFFELLFDPKVIYDVNATNKRFYVAALQGRPGVEPSNFSFIWLAVSRSPNPANLNPSNWCIYRINARRNAGTNLESWADFPALGTGADALVITTNQFTFNESAFTFSIIRALNKLVLSNNASRCPSTRLFTFEASPDVGDFTRFTVQPAQQLTSASSFTGTQNPVYLANSIYTAVTTVPSRTYRVYRLRNVASSPTLSQTTVTGSFAYFVPPNVPQRNEAGFIFTNDDRLLEAAGLGDAFWTTHATACSFPGSGNVSCNRVVRIAVGQSPSGALQASITQQRTFGSPGDFLFEPGIAVNKNETVAVPFHFASRTNNYQLSTWWTVKALGEGAFGPLRPLATGVCQQVTARTGDYSGAETDPVDLASFWLSGERARRIPQFDNDCLWETRIIRVTPGAATTDVAAAGARTDQR